MIVTNKLKSNSKKDIFKKNIIKRDKHDNSTNNNIFNIINNNNLKKLCELLKKDRSKINTLNNEGLSPLHISIIKGNIEIINVLLLNGANPNILSSKKKQTPLHFAYIYQNSKTEEIIKKLKIFKANENIYDIDRKKPIDYLNKKNIFISKDIINNNSLHNIPKNKKNKSNNNRIINKSNLNINKYGNSLFSKFVTKIEGDIDNCEDDDDNIFDNDKYDGKIKKKYYYQINLNNNKQIKLNKNNNDKNNDILTTSFSDSLEQNISPKNKNNDNKSNKINNKQSRNELIKKKNNSSFNYPILFNNIIINNLKNNKYNKENNQKLFQNNSFKNITPFNNNNNIDKNEINNNKIDLVFKEIIKKKRHSIKLRKSNSFYKMKKNNNTNEYIIPTEYNNYINKSNINYNKSIENMHFIKDKDKDKDINKNIKTDSNTHNNTNTNTIYMTGFSTENQTKNPNNKDKITIITNKDVVEFKYGDSFTEENNNSEKKSKNNSRNNSINKTNNINTNNNINNISINVLNKDENIINKNNIKPNNDMNDLSVIRSCNELKYWLDGIGLSMYYENFIENNIYNINKLINQMKNPEEKLGYDDIESILKIHKPGHIYRLLCNLEIGAGLIKENIVKFLIKKNTFKNNTRSNNRLKLSISQENNNCVNCLRINILSSNKKNDLKSFLNRYNLLKFYQNFYHNGFDLINFVMIQMFSSEPIDEMILENCFHIYEEEQRELVFKCINSEKNKILYFLNSNEYLNFELKDNIKYENIIFEENNNNETDKIKMPNNNACAECIIF